jgi:predicted CXXCH cytochrome family protein
MKCGAVIIVVLAWSVRALASGASNAECITCHDEQGASFPKSVHGGGNCTDCHTTIKGYPHATQITKVDCGSCHGENAAAVASSVHAHVTEQGCIQCHGGDAHSILSSKDPHSATYPSNLPRTCGTCHGNAEVGKKSGSQQVYSIYMDSIHGFALTKNGLLVAASCSSCHGSHKILPKKDPASRTAHANIPDTCGGCHAGEREAFMSGAHGEALHSGKAGPVCTSCHTAHQITRVETAAWEMKTTATCGGCHKKELATYQDTFHAQVSALGYVRVARCWDCHEYHDIRRASDPKSSINPANLPNTCGKCHSGVTMSFTSFRPHADQNTGRDYPLLHYSAVFMNLLLAGVLGFFGLHTLLWFIRARFDRIPRKRS